MVESFIDFSLSEPPDKTKYMHDEFSLGHCWSSRDEGGPAAVVGAPLQDIIINTTGQGLNQLLVAVAVSEVSDVTC